MILLNSQHDIKVGKYYLFYWNFSEYYDNSKHLRIAEILHESTQSKLLFTVKVLYAQDCRDHWNEIIGEPEEWSLDYIYGKQMIIFELTDEDIHTNVVIYNI